MAESKQDQDKPSDTTPTGDSPERAGEIAFAQKQDRVPPHANDSDDKNKAKAQRDWQRIHSRITLVFNGILAITAVAGGCFLKRQLDAQSTANEISIGNLTLAIHQQNDAITSAKQASDDTKAALEKFSKLADASARSAQAAEASIKIASAALRLAHRPWIAIKSEGGLDLTAEKPQTDITFDITNPGGSPALRVRGHERVSIASEGCEGAFRDFFDSPLRAGFGLLPPNTTDTLAKDLPVEYELPIERRMIQDGKLYLNVLGEFWYVDVFQVRHHTRFHRVFEPKTRHWLICDAGEEMD